MPLGGPSPSAPCAPSPTPAQAAPSPTPAQAAPSGESEKRPGCWGEEGGGGWGGKGCGLRERSLVQWRGGYMRETGAICQIVILTQKRRIFGGPFSSFWHNKIVSVLFRLFHLLGKASLQETQAKICPNAVFSGWPRNRTGTGNRNRRRNRRNCFPGTGTGTVLSAKLC